MTIYGKNGVIPDTLIVRYWYLQVVKDNQGGEIELTGDEAKRSTSKPTTKTNNNISVAATETFYY